MAFVRSNYIPQSLLALPTIGEASQANICQFNTDLIMKLLECICEIKATQSGSGTPSPANPRAINGYSELNLTRCGSNFLDISHLANKRFDGIASLNNVITENKIPIKGGIEYIWHTALSDVSGRYVEFYDSNDTHISEISLYGLSDRAFTAPDNACSFRAMWYYGSGISPSDIAEDCINVGSMATAYEPYNGQTFTIQFGQTVFGGEYDAISGKATITHVLYEKAVADMNNYDDFPGWINSGARAILEVEGVYTVDGNIGNTFGTNFIGNNDVLFLPRASYGGLTQTQWKANYPDLVIQFVMPLGTPIEIDVSSLSVDTIAGVNNVFCDIGRTQAKFFETVGHHIA